MSDPFAPYRLISDPHALARAGLFVAEGRLVVGRLLEDGRFRVHSVLLSPAAAQAMGATLARRQDVTVHECAPELLHEITGFNFHRGCLALGYRVDGTTTVTELASAARVIAIESVSDPDNVGGLFRTALALGVDGIVLDSGTADPLYRKAVRTSMAASLRVPWVRATAWFEALASLRAGGMGIVALTPHQDAVPLADASVEPGARVAITIGSEAAGLTNETLAFADLRVRIPVAARADSLNVVVAAAIALHALAPRLT
jgi:tRNA G18 (ribose-2'-O)-methylase SpoU